MSLKAVHSKVIDDIGRLRGVHSAAQNLDWRTRGYISELVVLRIHSTIEWALEEVAFKLLLGQNFCDGSASDAHSTFRARTDAELYAKNNHPLALRVRNPRIPLYLKWSNISDVDDNVKNLFPANSIYRSALNVHRSTLNEVRIVRNHCAHRSASTKRKYNNVVRNAFGVAANLSVPVFLLSEKRSIPPLLERYFIVVIALSKDLTKSQ